MKWFFFTFENQTFQPMSTTAKNILGIVIGLAMAMTAFMRFETIAHFAFPLPADVHINNAVSMKNYMNHIPAGALSLVLTGWLVGSILAGYFSHRISGNSSRRNPAIIGIILESATIFNFILLPHPTWLIVVSLLLLIPAVFVGHYLFKSSK